MTETAVRLIQPTSRNLLARILSEPDLPARIQELPPPVLGRLIDRVGLEDAGEIVALATTDQLAHVFDDDLWKNDRPGEEERFDAARFNVWLEVMLEAGDAYAAQRLAELPEDLVTLALHRQLLVLDMDTLALEMASAGEDAEPIEKALESCLYEEIENYRLIARQHDGWDSVLSVVLALDRDHHAFLERVLERCCAMSSEYIEENGGLQEMLSSEEMLESDVAGEREERRAEVGHVAPTTAKSFLALARSDGTVPVNEHDAVTRAYFRRLVKTPAPRQAPSARRDRPAAPPEASGLREILAEEGLLTRGEPALQLGAGTGKPGSAAEPLLAGAMRRLADEDPARFEERAEELAYLTNVLVAGCPFHGRRLRPVEAAAAVVAAVSLGLSLLPEPAGQRRKGQAAEQAWMKLREHPADGLFRLAWRSLHEDAGLAAGNPLLHDLVRPGRGVDRAARAR